MSEPHSGSRVTLAAVGDIMMDRAVQLSARALIDPGMEASPLRPASGFERLFEEVRDSLAKADIVFGNLETPIATALSRRKHRDADGRLVHRQITVDLQEPYDGEAYTGAGFSFNAHSALAMALKNTGFNIVSTANNHALDRGSNGVDLTIDALREAGIEHIGTRRSTECRHDASAPYVTKNINGLEIAFFAWTLPSNGVAGLWGGNDRLHQVSSLMSTPPGLESITAQIAMAREDPAVDLVVVSIHWGIQCVSTPSPLQRRLARAMSDAGADIILGHHPHVLQPLERYTTPDGRQALVAYSLGNFVSGYWRPWGKHRLSEQTSVILYVDVIKRDGHTTISDVRYLPTVSVSRTRNGARVIQVAALSESPEGSRAARLIENSLHGKTGALTWMSIAYLARNPFCMLLAASDVVWEGVTALRLSLGGSLRRGRKHHRRRNN